MAKIKSPRRGNNQTRTSQDDSGQNLSPEARRQLIEQAAYFRAQQRGFEGGDPLEDWLVAEREINRKLPTPHQQKQELAAYQKLRDGVAKVLDEAKESLSADTIRQALAQSVAQLKQMGSQSADTVDKVSAAVERDMIRAAQQIGTRWETFSEKTADLFHVWGNRGSRFLAGATTALGEWLQERSEQLIYPIYHSGEIAASGTLMCTACGEQLVLRTPSHLPACSKCRHTEFRRI